jgi:hypothetical protein
MEASRAGQLNCWVFAQPCEERSAMSKLSESHIQISSDGMVSERFQRLVVQWKVQSRFLSNSAQMDILKPYQQIIGMGPPVVALILDELRREPDQWFWALESITEQDPVPPEARGKVQLMAQAWVRWGEQQGITVHGT